MLLRIAHAVSERRHLLTVRDLLHIPQINRLLIDHDSLSSHRLHLDPVISLKCRRRLRASPEIRFLRLLLRACEHRVTLRLFLRIFCDILRHIAVHLYNRICDVEVRSRASRHDHRRNAVILIEFTDPLDERCDRLHIPVDDSLHQFVPDHEVCRARILIDQEKRRPRLDALHHIRRLRRTSAGVLCAEANCILSVRKVVDEHGDIRLPDAPPVLRADLHRRAVCDHIFPAVPCDMVVHAQLQRFQQCRFPMISASDNKRDPFPDAHSRNLSSVGKLQGHFQLLRGPELHSALHRTRGNAGLSRQDTAVRHKGAQPHLRQHFSDIMLVLREIDDRAQTLCIHIFIEQRMFYTLWHKFKQDLLQFAGVDRPAVCRESDLHPQDDIPGLRIDPAGSPLQHLLSAPAHRDEPALSRAFCLKRKLLRSSSELPRQLVLQGSPLVLLPVKFLRECGGFSFYMYADLRRRCERISLYMVNGQHIPRKLVCPLCIFIGRIAPVIDPAE